MPISIPEKKSKQEAIEELSWIWYTCLLENDQDIKSFPDSCNVLKHLVANQFLIMQIYQEFDDVGIYPMLKAWEQGVPVEDIVF